MPVQDDDWSCGHRIILYAESLLKQKWVDIEYFAELADKDQEYPILAAEVSAARLKDLCGDNVINSIRYVKGELKPFIKAEKANAKDSQKPADASGVNERHKHPEKVPAEVACGGVKVSSGEKRAASPPLGEPNSTRRKLFPKSEPSAPAAPEPAGELREEWDWGNDQNSEQDSDVSLETALGREMDKFLENRRKTKKEKTKAAKVKREVKQEDENDLKQKAEKIMEQRAEKKSQARSFSWAKSILRDAKFTYNVHFQQYHKKKFVTARDAQDEKPTLPKGHWNEFLLGVAGKREVTCEICRDLMLRFDIGHIIELRQSSGHTSGVVTERAIVAYEGTQQPPAPDDARRSRVTAGRPPKSHQPSFNIFRFLDKERPNMYHRLSEDEACSCKMCVKGLVFCYIYVYIYVYLFIEFVLNVSFLIIYFSYYPRNACRSGQG